MSEPPFIVSELNSTSDQVTVDFAKKMQKKGLHASGLGGREDKGKIMDFKVSFQYSQALDISSARRLIVETVLQFIEEINNNEKVRKFLYHYPFTVNDVIVAILPDCSVLNDQQCASSVRVSSRLGRINYYTRNDPNKSFIDLRGETFEEAMNITKEKKHNIPIK